MENDYNDKVSRVLSLYQRFMEGEVVDKEVEAARYGVSERSIQRDISAINNFFEQEARRTLSQSDIQNKVDKQRDTCNMQDTAGQQGVYQERDDKHT